MQNTHFSKSSKTHDYVRESMNHEPLINKNKHWQHNFKFKQVQVVPSKEEEGTICVMETTHNGSPWPLSLLR